MSLSSIGGRRHAIVFSALLLAVSAFDGGSPRVAAAQEVEGAQPAAEASDTTEPTRRNPVWWFIESSGWIGAVILGLSIYFIATVSRLFLELRLPEEMPPEIVEGCNTLMEQREYKSLYELVRRDDSMYSRVLSAGFVELGGGLTEARDAMERMADAVTVEMERRISMLAVLGTLGPMIGLLGTLKGMIASFSAIALYDTQLKASQVAGGISEALLLTFEGVALSVPAIYFYAIFRNRVSMISVTTLLAADEFMRRLSARMKSPSTPPSRPA